MVNWMLHKIQDMKVASDYIPKKFDIVSLFTKEPLYKCLDLQTRIFPTNICQHFEICHTESYFVWGNEFPLFCESSANENSNGISYCYSLIRKI